MYIHILCIYVYVYTGLYAASLRLGAASGPAVDSAQVSCTSICIYPYIVCVRMYVYVYICVCICVYIRIYIANSCVCVCMRCATVCTCVCLRV